MACRGTVTYIKPFGVFVELPGFRLNGLVPFQMVADSLRFGADDSDEMRTKALDFIVPPGSEAWVKVVSFKEKNDGSRVFACSMKVSLHRSQAGTEAPCEMDVEALAIGNFGDISPSRFDVQ